MSIQLFALFFLSSLRFTRYCHSFVLLVTLYFEFQIESTGKRLKESKARKRNALRIDPTMTLTQRMSLRLTCPPKITSSLFSYPERLPICSFTLSLGNYYP